MSYLVLARRWRPQKFADLVGQDVVVRTLKNALLSDNLAHAYLLCGIRGVGKTTIARLMAMAVNCQDSDSGEPCGACSACCSIADGANLDVQEMDAASHTGVDDVREILDGVRYPPTSLKTKVYIIDEAHMLSKSAFNALLKTLEEPPAHVLFILATTESDKLPVTVRSRCQRFDLRRLGQAEIRDYLKHVFSTEAIRADDDALMAIAQAADGSVRDALSLAERVLAYSRDDLKAADVLSALGLVGEALSRSISEAVFAGDAAQAMQCLRHAMGRGHGARTLLMALARLWHQLACVQVDQGLLASEINVEHRQWLDQQHPRLSAQGLDLRYQVLLQGMRDLSLVDERMGAEMVVMRLCGLHAISAVAAMPAGAVEVQISVDQDAVDQAAVDQASAAERSAGERSTDERSNNGSEPKPRVVSAIKAKSTAAESIKPESTEPVAPKIQPPAYQDIEETTVQAKKEAAETPDEPTSSDNLPLQEAVVNGHAFTTWKQAVDAYGAIKPGVSAMLDHMICAEYGDKVRLGLNKHQEKTVSGSDRLAFSEWLGREVLWESHLQHQGESLSQERAKQVKVEAARLRQGAENDPHVQALMKEMDAKLVKVLPPGVAD